MIYLKETTNWNDGGATPNHIYIQSDKKSTKIVGYIPENGDIRLFEKPMAFDKRKRTFVEVDINENHSHG